MKIAPEKSANQNCRESAIGDREHNYCNSELDLGCEGNSGEKERDEATDTEGSSCREIEERRNKGVRNEITQQRFTVTA